MPKKEIISFIDFFYPPFRKIIPLQTFRYAACGGFNTILDIFVFFLAYNFILHKEVLHLGFISFKPHIAAFIISFLISFPTGFMLMRYIVFPGSSLHGRVQLFRYFLLVLICVILNSFISHYFQNYYYRHCSFIQLPHSEKFYFPGGRSKAQGTEIKFLKYISEWIIFH